MSFGKKFLKYLILPSQLAGAQLLFCVGNNFAGAFTSVNTNKLTEQIANAIKSHADFFIITNCSLRLYECKVQKLHKLKTNVKNDKRPQNKIAVACLHL
jgi:hypothetical protein